MREVLWSAKSPAADSVCSPCFRPSVASTRMASRILVSLFLLTVLVLCGCGLTVNSLPLMIEPNAVSFGSVQVGQTQTATVTLHNPGYNAVTLHGMAVGDDAFTLSSTQTSVPAGASVSFEVTFAPSAAQSYSSQIAIMSDGGRTLVPVSGTGQQSSGSQGAQATPALHVSTTTLQFGSVTVGSEAQHSLTLSSTGTAPLQINALSANGAFVAQVGSLLPVTLQPGQALQLPVQFAPTTTGSTNGQLVIASNATASPSVTVSLAGNGVAATPTPPPGTPVLAVSSASVDFGSVPVGSQTSSAVTFTSSGTAAVVLQAVTVTGAGFAEGQLQLPLTLAPGQQVTLPLSFAPMSIGSTQGQIVLVDNATGSPSTIALTGIGVAAASPSLSITPGSVDFGNVTVGSDAFQTITLIANGTAPVTVNSIAVAGGAFSGSASGLPRVLQPSQQMSIKVQFQPSADGSATGAVTVSSNAATNGTDTVALHGNGVAPPSPSLAGSASSLSFGQVTVGSQAMKQVTVTSTGTAPATITGGSLTGSGYTATYAGVPVQNLSAPITLQPGQQITFNVTFDPAQTGAASGQLVLSTDTNSAVSVSLSGMGTAAPSPALTLSATSLDFGDVQVNAAAILQLTLTSSGTAPVTISSSTLAGQGFQISSVVYPAGTSTWPTILRPGQQVTLAITFTPTSVGDLTGSLTVASDASGGTTSVALSGTGEAAPAPKLVLSTTSLSFGPTQVGSKTSRTLTLSSSGDAPLIVSAIILTGTQFGDGSPALPVTLQPNQQMVLTVTFDPTSAGPDAQTLTVTSNDGSGPATVSLGGSGTATTSPLLSVNPANLDFGSLPVNTTSTLPVTLTSSGTAPVTVSAAVITGAGFSVPGASYPVTLNPNQSVTVQVQFDPATAGAAIGQLTIASDSTTGATLHVPLSGEGVAAAMPQLSFSKTALNFGNVTVNSAATLPLTLTSTGSAPVTVTAATLSGPGFVVSGTTFPVTLNPNQTVTLQVQFDPTVAGAANDQLTITSDSTVGAATQVNLSGTGTVAPIPQLTVSPSALAFGNVTVNSLATQPLTLTSTGTAPVTVSAATLIGAGFSDPGATLPLTLQPNQSVTLQVQFDPSIPGAATGQLMIVSNSSTNGNATVQLSGTGTPEATPQLTISTAALAFGAVPVNTTATQSLTLSSTGTAPVTVSAAILGGAGFSDSGAAFPMTLNPNQSVTLQVQFDPAAAGPATGQLTIASNSSGGATTVVSLTGTGEVPTMPQLSVSTGTLSFGNVTVNSNATQSVILTSSGTAPVTVNAVAVSGAGFSDAGSIFPVVLNPGQSVTLQVTFDPTTAGAMTGQLTISSNSATGGIAFVQLNGTGVAAANPVLLISTTALTFGNVPVGSTSTMSLTLSSTGTSPVTVTTATLSGLGFSDTGATFPLTLPPNQSATLQVAFDPSAAGAATGQLIINSNSTTGGTVVVQVSGTGTAVQHEIDLNWDAPSNSPDPVAGYNIYRSSNGGPLTKLNATVETQLGYADMAVQSGSTYEYIVKSVDANGVESTASNQISLFVP